MMMGLRDRVKIMNLGLFMAVCLQAVIFLLNLFHVNCVPLRCLRIRRVFALVSIGFGAGTMFERLGCFFATI
jgi:hypothetical protein